MILQNFSRINGKHSESAALASCLNYAGIVNPKTNQPFTEAMCFGIAGGIGAGYSFCPSVVRHGGGSGISIVGRYKIYGTDGTWFKECAERLGLKINLIEATSEKKAHANLLAELQANRPAIIFTGIWGLKFLGPLEPMSNVGMHSYVVYGIDEEKEIAYSSDIGAQPVTLTVSELMTVRKMVCSHKNRLISFLSGNTSPTLPIVRTAILEAITSCTQELLNGRMKTFSLPGWEQWAKMIVNDKATDGWLKVFQNGLIYDALRNVFDSIETSGTGGGLYRHLYSDFLDEATPIVGIDELKSIAQEYRSLALQWTELAESSLPDKIKPFKETKKLLRKKLDILIKKGSKGIETIEICVHDLRALITKMHKEFPLSDSDTRTLLNSLREQILDLHQQETEVATRLQSIVSGGKRSVA
jgi:hypothetical protein